MNHLDVVPGSSLADPITAWRAVCLCGSLLEDLLDSGPGSSRTTGHHRGTVTSTLLASRDTRANEQQTLCLKLPSSADGVRVVGVTTVDDDITLLEEGFELGDETVHSVTSFDEEDDLARGFQLLAELLDGVGALDVRS